VSADPGCGKSVLAKYLADKVLPSTTTRTTCYFFFKEDFEDQRSVVTALCSILHQVFDHHPTSFSTQILEKFQDKGATLLTSFGDLWDILISATTSHKKWEVVCILDALDECETLGRNQLIDTLSKFSRTTAHAPALRFLLTSRPYVDIKRRFRHLECDLPTIHLKGENEEEITKISHEIDMVIRSRVIGISRTLELGLEEQNVLVEELTLVPNRTYLWAHLVFEEIQNGILFTPGKIRSEIRNIPRTVSEAYNRILLKSRDISLARKLLHIVVAAARPLTLPEMALALAIGPKHQSISDIDLVPEKQFRDDIRQLCGLFVVVVDAKVYLLHQTAREFLVPSSSGPSPLGSSTLQWKFSLHPKESHRILAEICILRLSLLDFNLRDFRTSADKHQYIAMRTFLQYATQCWADHFREANWNSEDWAVERAISYCRPDLPTSAWFEIYQGVTTRDAPGNLTPLLVASYFGLSSIVERLPKKVLKDVNVKDTRYGRSSISWAAGEGHSAVLQWLLRRSAVGRLFGTGARMNSKDNNGRTPLHWASENGHNTIVKQLLEAGADTNAKDTYNSWTPLYEASKNGHNTIVKQLLEAGADANAKDNKGRTPLYLASYNGYDTIVKQLLKAGANTNTKTEFNSRTPLHIASYNGYDTIVKQLLEAGADTNAKDNRGITPLYWASKDGRNTIVKHLLKAGANTNAKDDEGMMPLHWASYKGHDTIVKQLLEAGADTNAKDKFDIITPLHWASENGHNTIVTQLLEAGADANAKNQYGWTPLYLASKSGYNTIVKQLLKAGANAASLVSRDQR
jgi:ankyrin repeat protein